MSITGGPDISEQGLVLYLDAGNNRSYPRSGTTWIDLIQGTTATLLSGSAYSSVNGGCISFDGVNDIVNIPYSTNLIFPSSRTTEMWIRVGNIGPNYAMFALNRGIDDFNITFGLWIDNRRVVRSWNPTGTDYMVIAYHVGNSVGSFFASSSQKFGTTDGDNIWHHVAASTNTSTNTISLYYDGQFVHSNTYTGTISTPTSSIRLGAGYSLNNTDYPLLGNVASMKIYDRVLSSTEISQNFNAQRSRFDA